MLRSVKELFNYVLEAEDGEIGRCKDFLFDDEHWTVRYMVADTGKWLPGRKVLVSPLSLGDPKWATRQFSVKLTKEQIENAPPLDKDAPVSRLYEKNILIIINGPITGPAGASGDPCPTPMCRLPHCRKMNCKK